MTVQTMTADEFLEHYGVKDDYDSFYNEPAARRQYK